MCAEPTIALLNMQLQCTELLRVRKQIETQSTCLTGTSKDSQCKCKTTSHLDSWMPNTQNPFYSKDHTCGFSHAEDVDIKQILFVSEREVYIYSLKVGAYTLPAGGGHSSPIWHHGLNEERLVFSDQLLCCGGGLIQLLKSPQTASSNHI